MNRLNIAVTTTFKKKFKTFNELVLYPDFIEVLYCLMYQLPLTERFKDHRLTGNLSKFRECHIKPDLLLAYQIDIERKCVILSAIGNHNVIFKDMNKK